MRTGSRGSLLLVVLAASAVAWALLEAALPPTGQRATESSQAQSSPIFTPAHPTARDAIRDFFNRRPMPVQPIAYSHKVHLATGMQCTDCHIGVDQGPDAVIPGVKFCMTCHQVIAADRPEIKKLAGYLARGEDIPWQRVYDYSRAAHVKFNHAPHIRAKVPCMSCHGDMTQQTTAQRVVNLTMGYCIGCHKQRGTSNDCMICHF
jgi:hypothetical protein